MSRGNPKIGQGLSLEAREQQKVEEAIERREQELDEAALAGKPPIPMTDYQRAKLEEERRLLQEALRGTRPPRPAQETGAPESINPRVKPAPEPEQAELAVVVEPVVPVPDPQLAEATARQLEAHAKVVAAESELAEADRVLAEAQAAHEAQEVERKLQHHRAILTTALAAAQRQQDAFQRLFDQYGGAGRGGSTHGPLARYAKTIPSGDVQRRTRLMELYREAGILMERIRLGYQAAHEAVAACEKALTIGGTGDFADLRLELAGRACEEAVQHDPSAVEQACNQVIAAVKAVDGEPSDEVVVHLNGPSREAVKDQTRAEGVGEPI
jgi:hypothetical protein